MLRNNPCKECGSEWHTRFTCPNLQKKPLAKVGKVAKETAKAVAKWKRNQTPTHEGYFICYICNKWIPYLEAEHVKSKVRHPDLRTDPNNLRPVCGPCNEKKASKDFERF